MRHIARKRFGQNFLQDKHVIENIVNTLNLKETQNIVEIGPGLGALTDVLLPRLKELTVIEIDKDLIAHLHALNNPKLTIIDSDVLKFDFASLNKKTFRVVGNLPYNISTPLIFHLLQFREYIVDMHFMLQKEVVERIVAPYNSKHYGRLSIMVQYFCKAELMFTVPASAFKPVPKVESAIIRLTPYKELMPAAKDDVLFAKIVKAAFTHRRKTIYNNLKTFISAQALEALSISPQKRPQELSVNDYVLITNTLDTCSDALTTN